MFTWNHLSMQQSDNHLVWVSWPNFPPPETLCLSKYAYENKKPQILCSNSFKVGVWNSHVHFFSLCGPWQQHGASRLCQTDKTDSWKAVKPSINQRETLKAQMHFCLITCLRTDTHTVWVLIRHRQQQHTKTTTKHTLS